MASFNGETEEAALRKQAQQISRGIALPMTLKSAMELGILDIIFEAGDGTYLSASEVAGRISGLRNPDAPALLDRMMSLLATFSLLNCKINESNEGLQIRTYGMAPLAKYFLSSGKGVHGPMFLLHHDNVILDSWNKLTEAVLEGGPPFKRAHGMGTFEYAGTDPRFNSLFNQAMSNVTVSIMEKILDIYDGFQGINTLVEVGGGIGSNLNLILSRCPNIVKSINYDLPHVVADAPKYNGVEHVGGDMFEGVPNGDVIIMKGILHDWRDEHCLNILRNCWKALPSSGKVIIIESLLPNPPKNELETQLAYQLDVLLMIETPSGKKRTVEEFKALALKSGFSDLRVACFTYGTWVLEFLK